ncbi:TonB-dependent receptor plug domain-containing protein [Natronoflexus pectinivorans]|nr:TonB-dependent receptor plug domain-containing protein [Natronoflexus pectinivorans]
MRRFSFFITFLLTVPLFAGESDFVIDSIFLEEVTTYSSYRRFQPGTKIDRIPASQMQISQSGNLEQVLSRFSPIYIKGNAGGLSTIRFRGTAPDHTAINFGGININSHTLGHSNMTKIPVFLFDRIDVQYGSSSAINGSGAIGGVIYLEQNHEWTKGVRNYRTYSNGSYGEHFYGEKLYLGNDVWESVTKFYNYENKNRFSFKNPYHLNRFTNPDPIKDRQQGAEVHNRGVLQQFNYLFEPGETLKSSFWYEESWHQVQPNMASNVTYESTQELDNKNFRSWVEYDNSKNVIQYKVGAGYVHDKQIYDNIPDQIVATRRLVTEGLLSYNLTSKQELRVGGKYKYIVPDVHAYSRENIKYEQRADAFVSWFYAPIRNLQTTVNLRQPYVTGFNTPFAPSLMAEYFVNMSNELRTTINAGVSRSYRIPTLNDRFWGTQGNPDLKSEKGINFEGGITLLYQGESGYDRVRINGFQMDVDNWIEWRNFGEWQARNIQKVKSQGVEIQYHKGVEFSEYTIETGLNYTYNPVKRVKDITASVVNRQQLLYAPLHMGNTFLQVKWRDLNCFTDITYTGERYYDNDGNTLPSHFLANVGVNYRIPFNQHGLILMAQIRNLLNEDYQNERYYAMPGRTYNLSVSVDLNFARN